jgi:hypothetical protein
VKHPVHRYSVTEISVHRLPWMRTWSYRERGSVSAGTACDGGASTTFPIRTRPRRSIACARRTPAATRPRSSTGSFSNGARAVGVTRPQGMSAKRRLGSGDRHEGTATGPGAGIRPAPIDFRKAVTRLAARFRGGDDSAVPSTPNRLVSTPGYDLRRCARRGIHVSPVSGPRRS